MSYPPRYSTQNVHNQFVLVMFHMARGNTICRKIHLLLLADNLALIADDLTVEYVTIVPIRKENTQPIPATQVQPELSLLYEVPEERSFT